MTTDVKNIVNELNILKRRIKKYSKIIEDQNKIIRSLRVSNINLNTGLNYYKLQCSADERSES